MISVQHTGRAVTWHPFPTARSWQTWELPDPQRAAAVAQRIAEVHARTYAPSPKTKLWTLFVAWMLHDGDRLDPDSFPKYAADLRYLKDLIGDLSLADCRTITPYSDLFSTLKEQRTSESKARELARTLGTVCRWAQAAGWWSEPGEMFGHHLNRREIRTRAFRDGTTADAERASRENDTGPERGGKANPDSRIRKKQCPTFEVTLAFSEALGDFCVERWGPDARYLGDQPVFQYLTGQRWAETLMTRPTDIDLDELVVAVHAQINKHKRYADGLPTAKATKTTKSREAAVWSWARPHIERIVGDALDAGRGVLFRSPVQDLWTFPRQFQTVYKKAANAAGYKFTSHWHRHAYASYNLAPRSQGGYERSLVEVAGWLGHQRIQTTSERYWHPVGLEDGWSDHMPGRRP